MSNLKRKMAVTAGKLSIYVSKAFNKSGTALPGKVALTIDKDILNIINEKCDKIILVTGTNGKTTTNNLLNHIIKQTSVELLSNLRGANMIQGVMTTYMCNTKNHYDYGIFEVDEGSLNRITKYLKPDYIIITNFFRDQLDRYGEIDNIVKDVYDTVANLPNTKLILNADDPIVNKFNQLNNTCINYGLNLNFEIFTNDNLNLKNCPLCDGKLIFSKRTYGHFGDYKCNKCDYRRIYPSYICSNIEEYENSQVIVIEHDKNTVSIDFPYMGLYNVYNVLSAYTLTNILGISDELIINAMKTFNFSLGRMDEMNYKGKIVKIILTKNPIGLSEVINLISKDKRSKTIIHILNDNPADGEDISWIWDANTVCKNEDSILNYYCSGIRAEEIALKKKYDNVSLDKIHINDNFKSIINTALEDSVEIIYILPTYTAVFDTRDYVEKITS